MDVFNIDHSIRLNVHPVLSSKAESKYERIYITEEIGDSGNLYSLFVSLILQKIISQPGIHRRENIHVEKNCDNASIFFLLNVKGFLFQGSKVTVYFSCIGTWATSLPSFGQLVQLYRPRA